MEGELEVKMILEMQTWFLLLMTDVVEKILMIDPEPEITTENLVTDQEIETETLKDLETEIATEKRRKAARRRKGRKAEIETEKIHITKKRRKRNEKDLETEIATGKRRKAARRRKGRKAEIET